MIKILYIHHSAAWGGASSCLINLINSLDQTSHEVKVLLLKHSIIAEKLSENDIKYIFAKQKFYKRYYQFFPHSEENYVKWFQIYRFLKLGIFWVLSRYHFAKKELNNHEYDIVHLNSSVLTDWLAPAKKMGKVIIHIREPFRKGKIDFLHYFFKSKINKYADKIIAISVDNAKRICIPNKTEMIYDFSVIPKNLSSIEAYSSKKVLYLGGSSSSKGFYIVVKALDYLDKDVRIYFCGNYISDLVSENILKKALKFILSYRRNRNKAIQKIINHPNAILIGLIFNVNDYLEKVNCLVTAFSKPHFSFPVVEAHMHMKPAIGSNVEGMEEIIKHNINGLVVPKNDSKALALAINELTGNPRKAKILGEEGYKLAIQKFTTANSKQFELLYKNLCEV